MVYCGQAAYYNTEHACTLPGFLRDRGIPANAPVRETGTNGPQRTAVLDKKYELSRRGAISSGRFLPLRGRTCIFYLSIETSGYL